MDENQRAAFVISQVACTMIEAMGMHAENMQRQALGHSMAYSEEAFMDLIDRSGIRHNSVLATLRGER